MSLELVIKENTEVMRQLIAAMQSSKTFAPDAPPQPKTDSAKKEERKGPFWWKSLDGLKTGVANDTTALKAIIDANAGIEITKVEYLQLQEKQAETTKSGEGEVEQEKLRLEDQPLPVAVALAALYGTAGRYLNNDKLAAAVEVTETLNGKDRNEQIDALTMALKGVPRATKLHGAGVFDLTVQIIEHWEALPGITERRDYAELLLDTPRDERASIKPKIAKKETKFEVEDIPEDLFDKAKTLIMKLTTGGYRNEAVEILSKFGAKKLGQVPQENMVEVVALAEKALEG
ncbi:hypothetical protein AI29_13200 [bacteria symbiont BFo2 of Frankliniella occidentalis]|nr:hypothetical protein AI29_13200 [bacteria symbiont BFo2 of Frankliniella occidentalis]KYP90970.1 hypothetical protein WB60_07200 [bacteria symbiont BFo2 of Frankliniella occidentalis]KYP95991.1 hypothetical protein WB67_04015 [bacteria symbiont BFo2 of Frankliniella occidentalis]